jgi:hypothetical protein
VEAAAVAMNTKVRRRVRREVAAVVAVDRAAVRRRVAAVGLRSRRRPSRSTTTIFRSELGGLSIDGQRIKDGSSAPVFSFCDCSNPQ